MKVKCNIFFSKVNIYHLVVHELNINDHNRSIFEPTINSNSNVNIFNLISKLICTGLTVSNHFQNSFVILSYKNPHYHNILLDYW